MEETTPEQIAYYALTKPRKTAFLIDFAYKFRKSMQTGQQRFTPAGQHRFKEDEKQFFWLYVTSRNWISDLDTPEAFKKQLSFIPFEQLRQMRKPQPIEAIPPRVTRQTANKLGKNRFSTAKAGATGSGLSFTPPIQTNKL